MARNFLREPTDVFALASTCYGLWEILEGEIYVADVLNIKDRVADYRSSNRCEPLPYQDSDGEPVRQDEGPHANPARDVERGFLRNNPGGPRWIGTTRTLDTPLTPRPRGRFPGESSRVWMEILLEEHPQTMLHSIACRGPVSSACKAIGAAKRFCPAYLDLPDPYGLTPVQLAAWSGQRKIVQLLLESGCAARQASDYVCWDPRPLDELINHLTRRSAPHIRLHARGEGYGLSERDRPFVTDALGLAILGGHEGIAGFLLREHYDEDLVRSMGDRWRDGDGHSIISPLHLAALAGMRSVVEILLAEGVNPNLRESCFHDCSPLHMASTRMGNGDVIQVLLDHGADWHKVDDQGRTVVQWAEAFGVTDLPAPLKAFRASG